MSRYAYVRYKPGSIGRVLHFLYWYCDHHVASTAQVGHQKIMLREELIAIFKWEDGIPEFDFVNPEFNENQERYREEAVLHVREYEEEQKYFEANPIIED